MTAYWTVLQACAAGPARPELPLRLEHDMSLQFEFQARRGSLHSP